MRENPGVKKERRISGILCRSDRGGSGVKTGFFADIGGFVSCAAVKKRTSGSQLSFQQNTPDENYPDGGQSRLSSYKIVLSDDGVGGECLFFPSGGAGTF